MCGALLPAELLVGTVFFIQHVFLSGVGFCVGPLGLLWGLLRAGQAGGY